MNKAPNTSIQLKGLINKGDFEFPVDLNLPASGVTAIFGRSGSGKTSLLRFLAGLDRHVGQVNFNDQSWQSHSSFLPTHQRCIAYVFQDSSLFKHLSVADNLQFALKRRFSVRPTALLSFEKACKMFDLKHLLARKPDTLSGGEAQRVALARALLSNPQLLLMDEPLASLDRDKKNELLPYFESVSQSFDLPIVYVSHSIEEVNRLADTLVLMERGKVQAHGPLNQLSQHLDLPFAQHEDAACVIRTEVSDIEQQFNLSHLSFADQTILVSSGTLKLGQAFRVQIKARDVSLTLVKPEYSSVLNVFKAKVVGLKDLDTGLTLVSLDVSGEALLSRITTKSAQRLKLAENLPVYAQVKTVSLLS